MDLFALGGVAKLRDVGGFHLKKFGAVAFPEDIREAANGDEGCVAGVVFGAGEGFRDDHAVFGVFVVGAQPFEVFLLG